MRIKSALVALLALIAGFSPVIAQQFPTVPNHTVIGRIGVVGDTGPSQAIPWANFTAALLGSNNISNAALAQMPAATIKCNPLVGIANVQDCTIQGLVGRGAPDANNDKLMIYDAAAGTLKFVTPGLIASSATAGVSSFNGQTGAVVISLSASAQIRLTLTQAVPVTTSDVTGATTLFLEPYNGAQLSIYDNVNWVPLPVAASTYSIPATQTQSGTTHTNTTLDGLTDTSQMVVGEQVTGTNIAANSVVSVIVSPTSVTLNNAATGSATNTMTFKLPPSTNYDVWGINNSGVPKMLWSLAWTNDTTPADARALQDGIEVKSADHTRRLLGTVRTTAIAGQIEDSGQKRLVSNRYNAVGRPIKIIDSTDSWNYAFAGYRQANGNAANQADIVFCLPAPVSISVRSMFSNSTATVRNGWAGIGLDSTSLSSHTLSTAMSTVGTSVVPLMAEYTGTPGLGKHSLVWLESGAGADIQTWYGDVGAPNFAQSGMTGWVVN